MSSVETPTLEPKAAEDANLENEKEECVKEKKDEVESTTQQMSSLTIKSFVGDEESFRKLISHLNQVINNPVTMDNKNVVILKYLQRLREYQEKSHRERVEMSSVEYIFLPEDRSKQRQRFNSICVTEAVDLLKADIIATDSKAERVHICADCDIILENVNDSEDILASLMKHFELEIHNPKVVEVAETRPIVLPTLSRRKAAMERNEFVGFSEPSLKTFDKEFGLRLEAALKRNSLNKDADYEESIKLYESIFNILVVEISNIDFTALNSSVAPIIMSIKDNVNQNVGVDVVKNYEADENEQLNDKAVKNQIKKYRYYGPIESAIIKLLSNHKLLTMTDDRSGKPAFFCVACEYYTLRFRYDSVLQHVFSESHVHNLSCVLQADKHIPCDFADRTSEKIEEANLKFLRNLHYMNWMEGTTKDNVQVSSYQCVLCKVKFDTLEQYVNHIVDENHMSKLSDKVYRKMKATLPDGVIPEEWGTKALDWAKSLTGNGKKLSAKDHIVVENFIKPNGKATNLCPSCDMLLKGPRQILFNHVRQKKHLKNSAPRKLQLLYENHCRPLEYYGSFGNYFICIICDVVMPSLSSVCEHIESDTHFDSLAKFLRLACNKALPEDFVILDQHKIVTSPETSQFNCDACKVPLQSFASIAMHVLSSVKHQSAIAERDSKVNRRDTINLYMKGKYVIGNESSGYKCVTCNNNFGSLRAVLAHTVFADHFSQKLNPETIFRFYLELKHNGHMLARNRLVLKDFGQAYCEYCNCVVGEESVKKHALSPGHKENMGANYNANLAAAE